MGFVCLPERALVTKRALAFPCWELLLLLFLFYDFRKAAYGL